MATVTKLTLLLVGHITDHPSGSTLMVQQLISELDTRDSVELHIVNTARPMRLTKNILVNAGVAAKTTVQIMRYIHHSDVLVFLASQRAMMAYGPIAYLLSRIFRRPLILRLLGGKLEEDYEALSGYRKALFGKTILSAEILAVETKLLVDYFAPMAWHRVVWYPNTRQLLELTDNEDSDQPVCRRFVFLGRVIEAKGIGIIMQAVPLLDPELRIDIYGPLDDRYTAEEINAAGQGLLRYKGVLTPEQVREELFNYDALILPTFYAGEGYPGVVLEAYSHGIPVIATRWRSIPEIVDDDSGMLIPIRSPEALADAMNRLYYNRELYDHLRRGVLARRVEFSDKVWTDTFLNWCVQFDGRKPGRSN
jgi:glycosyltransferase involved in cell wall biosynthesis